MDSKEDNRVDPEHQAGPVKRKLKMSFFTPGNKLTGVKSAKLPAKSTSVTVESVESTNDDYDKFVVTNQSSDESFEGVKWRASPVRRMVAPSSPLKNILDVNEESTVDVVDESIEEINQAELMLQKYGSGFLNFTTQNRGEIRPSSAKDHETNEIPKISLPRAKSSIEFSDSSKLQSWISKIDSESPKSKSFRLVEEPVSPSKNNFMESDPFSDEEEFEAKIKQLKPNNSYSSKLRNLKDIREDSPSYGAKLSYTRPDLRRYVILSQFETDYKTSNKAGKQKIVSVTDLDNKSSKIILRGEYTSLNIANGDVVNLVITHPEMPTLVDDSHNILIWLPDVLVSATTVSQQLSCPRKPVLTDKFNFPGETSLPLLSGILLHEVFQQCFIEERWDMVSMERHMQELIQENALSCFSIGIELRDLEEDMNKSLPYLNEWFNMYYKKTSKVGNARFSVKKALDIEENIWSPLFGIKGKVDVSLDAEINSQLQLLPMEIKTGREYISHHAQSSLYSLLFKDRYNLDINFFLLVYTKEKLTKLGEIRPADLRSLINLRNRIAEYLVEGKRDLPPVIQRSICDRCEVQTACMTLHGMLEDGTKESSGLQNFDELTEHLTPLHRDFYNYWDILITKEEKLLQRLKKDLWVMTSKEREEKNGKCLANMKIIESSNKSSPLPYSYSFEREGGNLQNSQIIKHDRVIISDEKGHFTLANAFVTIIRPTLLVLSVDRKINSAGPFRIDKDEMFHGMGLARFNVLNLFMKDGDTKRRDQIVELKPPEYDNKVRHLDSRFNSDQRKAYNKVLNTKDYSLILGMPGTGKTTLIAEIISQLVNQGKSVLLTSYTHSAVDNILLKVKQYNINMLRIGHKSRIHKDIQEFSPKPVKSIAEYQNQLLTPDVVGVTCLSINDPIFNLRSKFDYCIIDEASQVSFPISLGPLRLCDKFVLVGDHNQLPPLITHPDPIVKKELSRSLFQFLNDEFPESVTELTYQYRMCKDIMKLSNVLIYNNMLKCGSEAVANQTLKIPNPEGYKDIVAGDKDFWMKWVLNEQNRVIFLDHDLVPAYETANGEKIENKTEALLIWQIVEALTLCGVEQQQIGVMSLYRAQIRLLNKYLMGKDDIEVLTADQFQGRDKDVVVISLVRSNKENKVGDLLQEWRRINVAITRSKSKLIILGSKSTLSQGGGILKEFLSLIQQEKWIYKLPPNAVSHYLQANLEQSQRVPTKVKLTASSKVIQKTSIIKDIHNEMS